MKNLLFSIVFWLLPFSLIAQEPIELFQQFNGQYDFTALGNTLNLEENGGGCNILTQSSADLNLLPGQNIIAALLYWGGSGPGDFDVTLTSGLTTTAITSSRNFNISPLSFPNQNWFALLGVLPQDIFLLLQNI